MPGDDRCASDPKAPIQKHLLGCCSHLKPAPSTTLAAAYRKWVESISYHVSSPTGSCTLCTFNWSYDHVEIQWNTMKYPCLEPLRKSQRDWSCSLLQLSCNLVRYFKAFRLKRKSQSPYLPIQLAFHDATLESVHRFEEHLVGTPYICWLKNRT